MKGFIDELSKLLKIENRDSFYTKYAKGKV